MLLKNLSTILTPFFKLVILSVILMAMISCTKLPSTSTDEGNGDGNITDPDIPEESIGLPDDGFIEGMLNINTIRKDIYNDLQAGNVYATIGVNKGGGLGSAWGGSYYPKSNGSGYNTLNSLKNYVNRGNIGFRARFSVNPELAQELMIPENSDFNLYIADSKGNINEGLKTDKTLSYNNVLPGKTVDLDITQLLGINPLSPTWGLEGTEVNMLVAYVGTDGNKYYIRYPFTFTYID